jgi:uncharacterized membrane protein YdbT with pleckstrin-like domain
MVTRWDDDEKVVFDLHPHWRRLVVPVLALLVVCAIAGFGIAAAPADRFRSPVRWAVFGVAVLLIGWLSVLPYLRWLTTRYLLTTQRLVIRSGVLARHGRDVPLNRINDVSFSETLFERLLRSGTLMVESAGERGQIVLSDIPHVKRVQRAIYRMVDERQQRGNSGEPDDAGDAEPVRR